MPAKETKPETIAPDNLASVTTEWLSDFNAALARKDAAAVAELFLSDGHWRDILAFTWKIETINGAANIEKAFAKTLKHIQPQDFRLAPGRTPPRRVTRAGTEAIEAIIEFKTALGKGSGVLRLLPDPSHKLNADLPSAGQLRAWILLTALEELTGHEECLSVNRAYSDAFNRDWGGESWQDLRNKAQAYDDHEPTVLVVGGGQAGLGIAARLTHLGVDTLIVDKHERIGGNWRERYNSLVLHNEVFVNHLPYMPFPSTWPVYIPKDLLANWFEAYVSALELNYWSGTSMQSGTYDENTEQWSIKLTGPDGTERIVRPRHLVLATGVSAIPIWPDNLPGLDDYSGEVIHSGAYSHGKAWTGKKVLVLGTGNSGHDVAHDLYASGAQVTMIQRSSTHIVGLAQAQKPYALYFEGPPLEDCDLLATSFPFPVLRRGYQLMTKAAAAADMDILEGLTSRGFKLNAGVDDCGFQMSYLQRGGGYYFNVGASELIIEGKIGIMQFDTIKKFTADGAELTDGKTQAADLIILATGFKNMQDTARLYLGDEVADRVGPVWGFNEGGELRNMWQRTAQPGLWFTSGSLAQCRIYSKYLALQIKGCEEGLIQQHL